jgi:hypothetical protein
MLRRMVSRVKEYKVGLTADSIVHNENSIQRFPVKRHIVTSRSPS